MSKIEAQVFALDIKSSKLSIAKKKRKYQELQSWPNRKQMMTAVMTEPVEGKS